LLSLLSFSFFFSASVVPLSPFFLSDFLLFFFLAAAEAFAFSLISFSY
jgi:hypothetical protein